jgi:hypothetical protein
MADYTDNALLASIKALDNVVLPAVDPADPLASEQLRLVSGFLKFFRERLAYWPKRYTFELQHYQGLGQELLEDASSVSAEVAKRLETALEGARVLQLEQGVDLHRVRGATAALSECISALARLAFTANPDLRRRVEVKIMSGSKRWVDMQRSWFKTHGFELRPDELPEIATTLAIRPSGVGPRATN